MKVSNIKKIKRLFQVLLVLVVGFTCVMTDVVSTLQLHAEEASLTEILESTEGVIIDARGVVVREEGTDLIDIPLEQIVSKENEYFLLDGGLMIHQDDVTDETIERYEASLIQQDETDSQPMIFRNVLQNEDDTVSTDIKDYLTSVTIRKFSNGEWQEVSGENLTFANGDSIQAELRWKIDGEVYKDHKTYTYTLPSGFFVDGFVAGIVYKGSTTEEVGTFEIQNGIVTVQYYESYNTDNDTTDNKMVITATASLNNDENTDQIRFGEDETEVIIQIEGDGDFTVKKEAVKVYENNQISNTSKIAYTLVIESEYGTSGNPIKIVDQKTISQDTKVVSTATYDANSFLIVDENGQSVSFVNSANEPISYEEAVKVENGSFTIMYLPALEKGGKYTVTYMVDVVELGADNTKSLTMGSTSYSATVSNKVTATAGDQEHSDTTSTVYPVRIRKTNGSYNQSTNLMKWTVTVNSDEQSIAGYTFRDTSSQELNRKEDGSFDLVVKADGKQVDSSLIQVTQDVVDGQYTFSFVFPYDAKTWTITYYTKVNEGETAVQNNATILTPDEKEHWSAIGIGYPTQIEKEALTVGTADENGIVPITWKMKVTNLVPVEVTSTSYRIDDYIGVAYNINNTSKKYEDYHYGTVDELDAQLRENIVFTILDADGNVLYDDVTLNNPRGYDIRISYAQSNWKTIATSQSGSAPLEGYDTKVTYVVVRIRQGDAAENTYVSEVNFKEYTTYFDTADYNVGETWKIENQGYSYSTSKLVSTNYTEANSGLKKYVGIPSESTAGQVPTIWRDGQTTISYDYAKTTVDGKEVVKLYYRILIQPTADEDLIVTDTLPSGLKTIVQEYFERLYGDSVVGQEIYFAAYDDGSGDFQIGPFNGSSIDYDATGWTYDDREQNISILFGADNSMTISLKNRNQTNSSGEKILQADPDTGTIAIQYSCYIEDWEAVKDFVENDINSEHALLQNSVTVNGGDSTDVTADVVRSREVLAKKGSQVEQNGGLTATASYDVEINPGKRDLLENSDTLTFIDTISSSDLEFTLNRDSIKLYYRNSDGTKGEEAIITNIQIGEAEEVDGKLTQSFTLSIQDMTAYILTYEYNIDQVTNGTTSGTLNNKAEIVGVAQVDDTVQMKSLSAVASSDHGSLTLHKIDWDNNLKYIPNVSFAIEMYQDGKFVAVADSEFVIAENEDGTKGQGKVFDYNSNELWNTLQENTLYRIVELENPDTNYRKPTEEEATYFFIKENIGSGEDIRFESDEAALAKLLNGMTEIDGMAVSDLTIHALEVNTSTTIFIQNQLIRTVVLPDTGGSGDSLIYGMTILLFSFLMLGVSLKMKNKRHTA